MTLEPIVLAVLARHSFTTEHVESWRYRIDGSAHAIAFGSAWIANEAIRNLRGQLSTLQGRIDRIESALEQGRWLNSLGELQGAAPLVDVKVAAAAAHLDTLNTVLTHVVAADGD